MATDKVMVSKSKLDALVNAYNTLTGETSKLTLDQLAIAISEIETGGGDPQEQLRTVLENPTKGFAITNNATSIKRGTFSYSNITSAVFPEAVAIYGGLDQCTKLTSVSAPKCKNILTGSFTSDSALVSIDFPELTNMSDSAFVRCSALTSINFPLLNMIPSSGFMYCSSLATADLGACTIIYGNAFYGCSALTKLILRNGSVVTLQNVSAFTSTPISSGTGYVYVPDDLVESYKADSKWSTYANQIKPLSELPS